MYEDTLAKVELLSSLDRKELQVLAKACQERKYSAGTTIIKQNDTGVGLYIITSGHVKVTLSHNPDRAEEELATYGPGSVLGEMALLDDLPRSANVVAIEDASALLLPVWEFRTIVKAHPDMALKLLSVMSKRLRKLESKSSN